MISRTAPPAARCAGVLIGLAALASQADAQEAADPARIRAHTAVLAHDSLQGRGTASPGESRAARYITRRLAAMGIDPLPDHAPDGRMAVPLIAFHPDTTRPTSLRVTSPADTVTLRPPAAFRDFGGALLVAGPTPRALDILAPYPDLQGRVVLIGPPWTGLEDVRTELAARGAEGVIEAVPDPIYHRLRIVRGPVRFALDGAGPGGPPGTPRVVIGPEGIEAIGLSDVIRPPDAGEPPDVPQPTPETSRRVTVDIAYTAGARTGYNVAGLIAGSDPARRDEYVVVMAHYDHVGFGQPDNGDSIWNGFADNAAGVAAVLEVARILTAQPPPRSVIVLFTTGEEQGLLGATAFAADPPVPLHRIVAAVNIDGGAPPADIHEWTVAAPRGSELRRQAVTAIRNAGHRVRIRPVIADSDHWAFHAQGAPALFLYPNHQADGVRPHTPHDEWREDFPFAGLARYADLALRVVRAAASAP